MSEVFETEVRLALGRIEEKMNEFSEQLKRHDKLLHGKNGSVGIEMRLDRIEQSEEGRKWHVRTIWVALMALMAWVAKSLLGFIVLVGFVGCSTYTIERRVPIFDKDGQFLGESYVLLRETVQLGGKKIGSESLYLQDGEKIIDTHHRVRVPGMPSSIRAAALPR